jgi:hypothetical protein
LLSGNGYDGKLVLFNGSNSDPQSKAIYDAWVKHQKGTDRVTGSRTADMRAAIIDYFREKAAIVRRNTSPGSTGHSHNFSCRQA